VAARVSCRSTVSGMGRWVGLLVVVTAIVACAPVRSADTGDPIPSNPPGPELTGRLLAFDHGSEAGAGRVVEVRGGAPVTEVVTGVIAADLGAAGQLAYVRADGAIVRRDLAAGTDTVIPATVPAGADCLSWSPDGTRLDYLGRADGGLYVTTVDGATTKVDVPKQQWYTESAEGYVLPQPKPGGASVPLTGELTCGRWLDDRRLVFDRVADMPGAVTLEDDEEPTRLVPADTTTVAVLDPLRLVDSPEPWRLEDRCGDHVMTFVDDGTVGNRYVVSPAAVGDEQLAQAGWAAPGDGKLPSARAAFVDGSCDVLLLLGDASAWHPTSRYDVDTGKTTELKPTFDDDHNPPLMDPDTVAFDPAGDAWAVADGETLFVFNIETGGSTIVSGAGLVSKVLGWLPS